ncbi:MAG: hypothetical protein WAX69_01625 [Victivallales bacterium]
MKLKTANYNEQGGGAMHLMKVRRVNRKSGTTAVHYLRVEWVDGVIKRTYVPRSELGRAFAEAMRWWIDRTILWGTRKYDKMANLDGKEIRSGIESLGLTMRSRRKMCRSRNYLTIEAARHRFELLDEALRDLIGTPENLLAIDRRSESILHSLVARGRKGITAHDAFALALTEFLEAGSAAGPQTSLRTGTGGMSVEHP